MAETQSGKNADRGEQFFSSVQPPAPVSVEEPEPLPFGQNLLGITFLAEDWEDDLPLELFEGDDSF